MQMADVIHRTGTGLEGCGGNQERHPGQRTLLKYRCWQGTPQRVKTVRTKLNSQSTAYLLRHIQSTNLRNNRFIAVNLSRYLNDGLIGNRVKRVPLTTGVTTWAFVFSSGNVYVGEGTRFPCACRSSIADGLPLQF